MSSHELDQRAWSVQLAKRAGARVIITSSSEEKLERARAIGADDTVNYRQIPEWQDEVLRLTDGIGADLAVDVTGPATLNRTLKATRLDRRISLMGALSGFDGPVDTGSILTRRITLQGIYVGSVATLRAVAGSGIEPQIDQVFAFEEAEAAYETMQAAAHFGKLVVQVAR